MNRFFLLLLSNLVFCGIVRSQTCSISVGSNVVCIGNVAQFTAVSTGTVAYYRWDFGNGAKSTQTNALYQYPSTGDFTPSLFVKFTDSTSCSATGSQMHVVAKPKSGFFLLTEDTQCFKGNRFCIQDTSTAGPSGAKIVSRIILWGDGASDSTLPAIQTVCYSYSDPFGGSKNLVLEVRDENGCTDRTQKDNLVTYWSKMQALGFETQFTRQCGQTPVYFNNTS